MPEAFRRITANHSAIYSHYDPASFVGRAWLVEEVARFRDSADRRHLVIIGEPGSGKSAFAAYLAETWNCPRHFIRVDNRDGVTGVDPKAFLLSIGTQLFQKYGPQLFAFDEKVKIKVTVGLAQGEAEVVGRVIDELHTPLPFLPRAQEHEVDVKVGAAIGESRVIGERINKLVNNAMSLSATTLLHIAVIQPLQKLYTSHPHEKVVIVIDALDEVAPDSAQSIVGVIPRASDPDFPPNLKLVMTSRPSDRIPFHKQDLFYLDDKAKGRWQANRRDTKAYILKQLARPPLAESVKNWSNYEREAYITKVQKNSDGNFLYLYHFFNEIADTAVKGETDLKEIYIPKRLDEIYGFFAVAKIRDSISDWIKFTALSELSSQQIEQWRNLPGVRQVQVSNQEVTLHVDDINQVLDPLHNSLTLNHVQITNRRIQQGIGGGAWEKIYLPLLGVLAVAQEALNREQLAGFAQVDVADVDRMVTQLKQFLDVVSSGQKNCYSIYHRSFSEYLLDRYRNQDYPLDGPRYHHKIATYYRPEGATWREVDWEEIKDQYVFRHLGTHLEASGHGEELHELLVLETQQRQNSWYEAKATIGDTGGYITDVQHARRLAETAYSFADSRRAEQSIDLQCRYACILSSINSLAHNMPADLLIALVDHGVWPWQRALIYVQRIADLKQRLNVMLDLLPVEEAELDQWRRETQQLAQKVNMSGLHRAVDRERYTSIETEIEQWQRGAHARRQTRLAAQPPERKPERSVRHSLSISEFLGLGAEHNPYERLLNEIPYLSEPEQKQALDTIMDKVLGENSFLQENLVCLFSRVPASLRGEVLSVVRSIENDYLRLKILYDLISCAEDEECAALVQESLELVFATNSALTFGENVKRLAPYLSSSLLRQTLTALCKLKNDEYAPWKVEALADLAPYLSGQDREMALHEAITTVKDLRSWRQKSLAKLIPLLPKSLLAEAVKLSQAIDDGQVRFFDLLKLFPYLPDPERTQVWDLCAALTPPPSMPTFLQTLGIEWGVKSTAQHLEALLGFAPVATAYGREIILKAVLAELSWVELEPGLLTQLVKAFPPHEREAAVKQLLSAAQESHIERQTTVLVELLPFLADESSQEQILREALTKPTAHLRGTGVIQRLAPLLPEKLVWAILQKLTPRDSHLETTIPNPHSYIPKPYIYNPDPPAPDPQGSDLWNMISELNIDHFSDNLKLGFNLDNHEQASIAFALIMRLAELGHAEAAHNIAKAWKEEGLATLALTRLPSPQIEEAFAEFVRQEDYRTKLAVPKFVVEQQGSKTDYSDHQRLSGSDAYQAILAEFSIRLAASGHVRTILNHECMKRHWSRNALSGYWRAKALSQMIMHLDDDEDEVRNYAQEITEPLWRARALIELAPQFKDEDQPYYEILQQAFEATLDIANTEERWERLAQLTSLVETWPKSALYEIWKVILDRLSSHNRQYMIPELCRLAPMIAALGGPEAAADTLDAIATTGRWWP